MQLPPVDRSPSWRPQGADLYSTGASGAPAVRPINAPNPVESMDRLGEGAIVREPDKPSAPEAMWRASGSAVELAQDINKMTLQERLAQQVKEEPLTYSDPKIKRTSGL